MIVLLAAALAGTAPTEDSQSATPVAATAPVAGAPADAASPAAAHPVSPATSGPDAAQSPIILPPLPADGSVAPVPVAAPQAGAQTQTQPPAGSPLPDSAAIVVTGRTGPPPGDPVMAINQVTFAATQAVDKAILEPAAKGYEKAVPSPLRAGLRHFFANLTEPVIALNFLLQLHPGKAAETLGRFAINSTIGIGGLLDVAKTKTFNLPYRRNGFAYTLGYYGIGPGPFLFVPLVGPTSLRDVIGLGLDRAFLPVVVGGPLRNPTYVAGSFVVRSLNDRLADDERIKAIRKTSDPYSATKDAFLAARKAEIEALHFRKVPGAPKVAPPAAPQAGAGIPVPPPEYDDEPEAVPAPAAPATPATAPAQDTAPVAPASAPAPAGG